MYLDLFGEKGLFLYAIKNLMLDCGSSSKMPASQAWSPDFKHKTTKKTNLLVGGFSSYIFISVYFLKVSFIFLNLSFLKMSSFIHLCDNLTDYRTVDSKIIGSGGFFKWIFSESGKNQIYIQLRAM
jgi:hypothetical protein